MDILYIKNESCILLSTSIFSIIALFEQLQSFLPRQGPAFFGTNPQVAQNVLIQISN